MEMKRLLYYLRIIDLVWTVDQGDGEVRLRTVWHKNGKRYVYGICGPTMSGDVNELGPKGTFNKKDSCFIDKWYPYKDNPKKAKDRPLKRQWLNPFFRRNSMAIEMAKRLEGK